MVSFNGLVADPIPKTNFNFSMPPELAAAFESAAAELAGKKERWMVCSAAILMLLEATPEKGECTVQVRELERLREGRIDSLPTRPLFHSK